MYKVPRTQSCLGKKTFSCRTKIRFETLRNILRQREVNTVQYGIGPGCHGCVPLTLPTPVK